MIVYFCLRFLSAQKATMPMTDATATAAMIATSVVIKGVSVGSVGSGVVSSVGSVGSIRVDADAAAPTPM